MQVGFGAGRYENKYLVTEETAGAMRSFVAAHIPPDEFMPPGELEGYLVHSLYLDSPWYSLYRESTDGHKNRHKLRIRFYDDRPDSPAFLEIKSRVTDTIRKQRVRVTKDAAMRVVMGQSLLPSDLQGASDTSRRAADEFCMRASRLYAKPAAMVSYRREAYVSHQAEAVRITFDRHITGRPFDPAVGLVPANEGYPINCDLVVAEFKYVGFAPRWMDSMVRDFGLRRVSFPKYVHCLDAVQPRAPHFLSRESVPT
jgi:hypothetical protein